MGPGYFATTGTPLVAGRDIGTADNETTAPVAVVNDAMVERFWRGKGVRTDGAGLGLAIVMEIVRAHGASVTVSNRVPRGARFDLRFRAA